MILPLTTEMVAHAYDYLCCCLPFSKWSLPPSDDVKFRIIRSKRIFAQYQMRGGVHHIDVSSRMVGSHMVLLSTLSHELIHLHLGEVEACDNHGPNFQMLADEVCEIHDFDRLTF